jgi:hypothetical protein
MRSREGGVVFRYIAHLFLTPSAYLRNWRGFVTNQAGHGAIGLVLAHTFLGWGTLALYAAWEIGQYVWNNRAMEWVWTGRDTREYLKNATISDCIGDWAYVSSGVMAVLIHPAFLILTAARLIEGALERVGR